MDISTVDEKLAALEKVVGKVVGKEGMVDRKVLCAETKETDHGEGSRQSDMYEMVEEGVERKK